MAVSRWTLAAVRRPRLHRALSVQLMIVSPPRSIARRFVVFAAAHALLVTAAACSAVPADAVHTGRAVVAGTRIAVPRSGSGEDWPMPAGDYASSRYSALTQITPANARNLHVAWTFSTGVLRGHEGQPLVVDNTMYL